MEMSIDEAIKRLELGDTYNICSTGEELDKDYKKFEEAFYIAIDTMRKYQKITEIIKDWKTDTWTDGKSYDCMIQISEVVENGNDN